MFHICISCKLTLDKVRWTNSLNIKKNAIKEQRAQYSQEIIIVIWGEVEIQWSRWSFLRYKHQALTLPRRVSKWRIPARRENDAMRGAIITQRGSSGLSKPARPYINATYTYNFDVDWLLVLFATRESEGVRAAMRDLMLGRRSALCFILLHADPVLSKCSCCMQRTDGKGIQSEGTL